MKPLIVAGALSLIVVSLACSQGGSGSSNPVAPGASAALYRRSLSARCFPECISMTVAVPGSIAPTGDGRARLR